jgi:hypothetical protein
MKAEHEKEIKRILHDNTAEDMTGSQKFELERVRLLLKKTEEDTIKNKKKKKI